MQNILMQKSSIRFSKRPRSWASVGPHCSADPQFWNAGSCFFSCFLHAFLHSIFRLFAFWGSAGMPQINQKSLKICLGTRFFGERHCIFNFCQIFKDFLEFRTCCLCVFSAFLKLCCASGRLDFGLSRKRRPSRKHCKTH